MVRPRHVPQRTCIACRKVAGKADLVRVVRTPLGQVRLDATGKLAGRGAYLCRSEVCLAQAMKRRQLSRALGVAVSEEAAAAVQQDLRAVLDREREKAGREIDAGL